VPWEEVDRIEAAVHLRGKAEELGLGEGDGTIVIDELLIGRQGLLRRLRGPGGGASGIPWANVVDLDRERVLVRV
jgi:hypothetical protein